MKNKYTSRIAITRIICNVAECVCRFHNSGPWGTWMFSPWYSSSTLILLPLGYLDLPASQKPHMEGGYAFQSLSTDLTTEPVKDTLGLKSK